MAWMCDTSLGSPLWHSVQIPDRKSKGRILHIVIITKHDCLIQHKDTSKSDWHIIYNSLALLINNNHIHPSVLHKAAKSDFVCLFVCFFSDPEQVSQLCEPAAESFPPELPAQLWDQEGTGEAPFNQYRLFVSNLCKGPRLPWKNAQFSMLSFFFFLTFKIRGRL